MDRSDSQRGRRLAALLLGAGAMLASGCTRVNLRGPGGHVSVDAGRGGARVSVGGPGGSVRVNAGRGGANVSINGPITEFEGNDFYVGIFWFETKFKVSAPPREVDGEWKMVVDGVLLTRVENPQGIRIDGDGVRL